MTASRAIFFTLALIACGSDPAPPPPPTTTAPPTTIAAPIAPPIAPPPPTSSAPAPLDAAQRATAREAVRAGRAAVATSQYADALVAFQRALAIDGSNRRLQCEAGYVAHLAGDEPEAQRLIAAALTGIPELDALPDDLLVPYAQCLYNAGLVLEAGHRPDDARRAYVDSLSLRPNATVQQHLDALDAPPPPPPAPLVLRASMTDDEIRSALGTRLTCPGQAYAYAPEADAPADVFPVALDEGVTAPDVRLSLFSLYVDTCESSFDDRVLVVRAGDRIAAFLMFDAPLGGGTEHGAEIASESVRDIVPGGLPEILFTVDTFYGEPDGEGCVSYEERASRAVVCTLEPEIACAQIDTARSTETDCDDACLAEDGQHCGRDHHPRAGTHRTRPLVTALTFPEGQAVLGVTSDTAHVLPAGLAGTHDLATLIRLSPLAAL